MAERSGTLGGRRVLVIGVIHGNEDAGVAIVDELRAEPVPDGVELWIVESMNPDGQAAQQRGNANGVDLNRNFPYNWGPIGVPGDSQYAGIGPASEPETQAIINFMTQLQPDITVWYHQDLFVVNPSQGREGRVRERYAQLTGLPMGQITGGTYTGIAATWARNEFRPADGVAFIVELGADIVTDRGDRPCRRRPHHRRRRLTSAQPVEDRCDDILTAVVLQEVTTGLEPCVRLAGSAGDTVDEALLQVTEHEVAGRPEREHRRRPLLPHLPGSPVRGHGGIVGCGRYQQRELAGTGKVRFVGERRPVGIHLGIGELASLTAHLQQRAAIHRVHLLRHLLPPS